jgi:hypothetical protein
MVKQPTMHETSEFTMSSEDFPALPGPPPSSSSSSSFNHQFGHAMSESKSMSNGSRYKIFCSNGFKATSLNKYFYIIKIVALCQNQ